ncbi:glycosyltransferase [Caproiciproducens sp. NJN-50]|uniref:glycosyltransferase n=1 Tax=Acutalibacteraceae TaxID=3082771 RepID=UPI000FFDF93F|nr:MULTISPECIES: glycosyltransferase [Acutalibacteraceae]QAT49525.1 glycosyltransferase [Caproiciproducens sp. NJN-50]
MNDCLVLLTKKYPFDSGEEFIENEVPLLAKTFRRVILIATSVSDGAEQTRPVPDHVEVHSLSAPRIRRAVLPRLAFSALKPLPAFVAGSDREQAGLSFRRKLFCSYFLAKSGQIFKCCRNILSAAGLEAYDGVTFYSYWFYDTALAAANLKREFALKNSRAVSRAHRYDLYADQNPAGFLPMREYLLQNLDKVYPCSLDGGNYLIKYHPRFAGKIRTAYLGTQDRGLSPDRESGVFHLVSCCHISPVKRVDLLAHSLALLKDSGLRLKWTHFGAGDGLDSLRDYAKENLSFMECSLPGEISNPRLMEFYRENPVDCFINTSSSEGLPVSIMEAASFGIPVIATDVGGTAEIVTPEETGYLLPCDFGPNELAEKIELLYHMPSEKRQKMRKASRELWAENFCSEQNYARFAAEITPKRS